MLDDGDKTERKRTNFQKRQNKLKERNAYWGQSCYFLCSVSALCYT